MYHPLHLDDIRLELLGGRVIAKQLESELHPGQGRAQVMRYSGQHLGSLAYLPPNPVAHLDEGDCRLTNLDGTFDLEERHFMALAKAVGRRR